MAALMSPPIRFLAADACASSQQQLALLESGQTEEMWRQAGLPYSPGRTQEMRESLQQALARHQRDFELEKQFVARGEMPVGWQMGNQGVEQIWRLAIDPAGAF